MHGIKIPGGPMLIMFSDVIYNFRDGRAASLQEIEINIQIDFRRSENDVLIGHS